MMLRPRDSYDQRLIEAQARHHAGTGGAPLGARRVRQLRRDRALLGRAANCASTAPFASIIRRPTRSISRSRIMPGLPVLLRRRRDARSVARDRAAISRPRARHRPLGAAVPAPGRPTGTRDLLAAMTQAITALHLRRARGDGTQDPVEDAAARQRQLPRLRRLDDGGGALAWASPRGSSRAICTSPKDRRRTRRRRRHPCLARGLPAGRRLDRVRSDQRHRRQPRSDPRRGGARPAAGGAGVRHLDRLSVGFHRHEVEVAVTADSPGEAAVSGRKAFPIQTLASLACARGPFRGVTLRQCRLASPKSGGAGQIRGT